MIYFTGEDQPQVEMPNGAKPRRIEEDFIEELTNEVMDALNIPHNQRRIVEPLMKNRLEKKLNAPYKNRGLLQQYKAYCFDRALERFNEEFDIPEEKIVVDHNHADHAKFATLIKTIKDYYEPLKAE